MRNSDPGLRVVFTQRPDSDFNSMFAVQTTCRNFQHKSNSRVSCDESSLLGRVYSRQALAKNCSPVSFVMKYCPISTTCMNPASIQNLLTLFSCESISIRSSYRCNRRFWCDGMPFSKGTSALISLRTIDCPINTSGCPDRS